MFLGFTASLVVHTFFRFSCCETALLNRKSVLHVEGSLAPMPDIAAEGLDKFLTVVGHPQLYFENSSLRRIDNCIVLSYKAHACLSSHPVTNINDKVKKRIQIS